MKPIPPQHHDRFLNYLNLHIQNDKRYDEVVQERSVSQVLIECLGGMDYTIIDFRDSCTLIISGVYAQFETTVIGTPPPGAA